jgi:hypothetical protein
VEVELGGQVDRYSDRSSGGSVPVFIKLGLSGHTQLGILGSAIRTPGVGGLGTGDMSVVFKWRVADDVPVIGSFALLPGVKFATGSSATGAGTGTTDASLVLISSNTVGPVALDVNVGYTRRNGDGAVVPRDATLWAVSLGGPGSGDIGWVAEVYGLPGTSGNAGQEPTVAALVGPTFSAGSLAFDVGVIVPIVGPKVRSLFAGGVWNVGQLWR